MEEIYSDIPGYESLYQVSNFGNVKSFRNGTHGLRTEAKLLKPGKNNTGYLGVVLIKNGKRTSIKVHQLVAITFLNHKPNRYEKVVNHIDNNPLNNYLHNLELVTPRYNTSCHRIDPGVIWDKSRDKWQTRIVINKKTVHLGRYIDKKDAINIYQKALANIHLYNGSAKEFRLLLK